jgi:hypothetical protein
VQTPLGRTTRREARALAAVVAGLVIAVAVVLFAILHGGSSEAGARCVRLTVPSSTGGATLHACGPDAARWCRSVAARQDAFSRKVKERCRNAGYL